MKLLNQRGPDNVKSRMPTIEINEFNFTFKAFVMDRSQSYEIGIIGLP